MDRILLLYRRNFSRQKNLTRYIPLELRNFWVHWSVCNLSLRLFPGEWIFYFRQGSADVIGHLQMTLDWMFHIRKPLPLPLFSQLSQTWRQPARAGVSLTMGYPSSGRNKTCLIYKKDIRWQQLPIPASGVINEEGPAWVGAIFKGIPDCACDWNGELSGPLLGTVCGKMVIKWTILGNKVKNPGTTNKPHRILNFNLRLLATSGPSLHLN